MNTDKRQPTGEQPSFSASSLPLFSPAVAKNELKELDFSTAVNGCLLLDFSQRKQESEVLDRNCKSLHYINIPCHSCKSSSQRELVDFETSIPKLRGNTQEVQIYDSLPVTTKEKISESEGAFEVPELTAESLVSSEEIDVDNESNGNDLPLSSIVRYKIDRVFQEQSEGSEDNAQPYEKEKSFHSKQEYAYSKGSDISETDEFPPLCKPCLLLKEQCTLLETENADLIKQVQRLSDELAKCEAKSRQEYQFRQEHHFKFLETSSPLTIKDYFFMQSQDYCKTLSKVNQLLQNYAIDFPQAECECLSRVSEQFRKFDEDVLGREAKHERKQQLQQIHLNYKKLILRLVRNCQEKEAKRDSDFKRFISTLIKKQQLQIQGRSFEGKTERSRRKSKTYAEKEENTELDFIELIKVNEQYKQKIDWLELTASKEKENAKHLERLHKELQERYVFHIGELNKERNRYKGQISKYSHEFSEVMVRMVKEQASTFIESDFFRNLSQRVFQISNYIPFEDNDEQNLFAPDTEQELFDMIERIRRFYITIEAYNLGKESEYQSERSCFTLFLKELVEENKVSSKYILEKMLQDKKFERLNYLKELIQSSRRNLRGSTSDRHSNSERHSHPHPHPLSHLLQIERTKSYTFHSLNGPSQ